MSLVVVGVWFGVTLGFLSPHAQTHRYVPHSNHRSVLHYKANIKGGREGGREIQSLDDVPSGLISKIAIRTRVHIHTVQVVGCSTMNRIFYNNSRLVVVVTIVLLYVQSFRISMLLCFLRNNKRST